MDISLAIPIALTAFYAGAVTLLVEAHGESMRTAPVAATRATAAVAGAFALMILVAYLAYPATLALAAVFSFLVTRRTLLGDVGPRNASWTATVVALLVAASFMFVSYLAPMALIGALGVHQLLRLRLRARPALLAMGGALSGLLAVAAVTFAVGLSTM